jgi:hypothetical protein
MSYRNDHDAALARIDALEAELAKLRTPEPPPVPRSRWPRVLGVLVPLSLMAVSGVFGYASRPHKAAPPAAETREPDLRACKSAIAHVSGFDAATADPHATAPRDVHAIEPTGAACRSELASLAQDLRLTQQQRDALRRWSATEDELAGDISRIVVYYDSDPYKLDGYTTAGQLWKEYDAAVHSRDAALFQFVPST